VTSFAKLDELHCSLGDRQSYTDPVTNRVVISGLDFESDLAGMTEPGKYPQRLFPTLLHEMVHHWCFHSLVGTVFSYLHLRARRTSFELTNFDMRCSFDVVLDLLRYEAGISLMRPLAEGIALFAEFDATPGSSTVISKPLAFTNLLFNELRPDQSVPFDGLLELLATHRLGNVMAERKANLLVQPFACDDGGYLPGYMLVKNLWWIMVRERGCRRFGDRDLFLSYLRAFFYDDYEFVATLLEPNDSDYQITNSVSVYFQKRLNNFIDNTTDELIREFESEVERRAPSRSTESVRELPDPWPGSDPKGARLGRERLRLLMNKVLDPRGDGLVDSIRRIESWVIAQRELMCIGTFRQKVSINKKGLVQIGRLPGPVLLFAADDGVEAQEEEGLLEFFLAPTSMYRAVTVTIGGQRVATNFLGSKVSATVEEEFKRNALSYTADPLVRQLWIRFVSETLREHGLDDILEYYRSQISRISNDIYSSRALMHTPDEYLTESVDALRTNGFFEILGKDASLVRSLARLTLAVSACPLRDFVEDTLRESLISMQSLLAALNQAHERFHIAIVDQRQEFLVSYL
jgi:hypothetical protein